jgi:hypothetical protein
VPSFGFLIAFTAYLSRWWNTLEPDGCVCVACLGGGCGGVFDYLDEPVVKALGERDKATVDGW